MFYYFRVFGVLINSSMVDFKFQITHIDFLKKGIRRGALILPLKKYCSWFNEQISEILREKTLMRI